MSAATFTVPTVIPVLVLCALVCVPVWFASTWLRDRIQPRVQAYFDAKLASLEAEIQRLDAEAAANSKDPEATP
ncbi:MAG TPA: hypothetical protein VGW74_06955 [Propionibacteriaceae bacterium]|nr:hypothetical protein [Propionibacteriaceae bacterium]